ncbi:putative ex11b-like protein [Phialemonium atrogriseum]|uniref:Ex11b-like protein n=1 Tax=Phialemonium atrogriseum TaxID=1093897 RepID=A0AAJ0FNB5_9PEZI|nr:putative ex11b-like protein [Phialemonium atrogriseum]KAK1766980.1 putative ex11b-like protein [Phialemonium atrogriseum]
MASGLEQFIRFGTDAAGLERFLRLIQAILQVTLFYRLPFNALVSAIHLWQAPQSAVAVADTAFIATVLTGLRSRVALGRRFFRMFRFVESFHAAHRLWGSLSPSPSSSSKASSSSWSPGRAETYLDVAGRTFNGMYLLLETALLPDALGVEGLRPWGARGPMLAVEAQRFWFLSLACGALAGALRLLELWALAPVPETGGGYGDGSGDGSGGGTGEEEEEKAVAAEKRTEEKGVETSVLRQQQARERERRNEQREGRRRETVARSRALVRRLVADVLDLALPGSVVGYVKVDEGSVGLAMLGSTVLTGLEVWERCGREADAMSG